jgi:methyl-accepting chemotaxis protein
MLLAFTAIVLVGAVVPLTLNATSHDRTSFSQAAAGTARTDGVLAQAELILAAQFAGPRHIKASAKATAQAQFSLLTMVKEARQAGDSLLVLTSSGHHEINAAMPPGNWNHLVIEASEQAQPAILASQPVQPVTEMAGSYVIAAMPVVGQGPLADTVVGTVLLARSTKSLDHEILALWVILGSVAVVAIIAAALLAFGLARWVSRPLKGLDAAARRLADGDLAIRA